MNPIVVFPDRRKLGRLALGSLALVAAGAIVIGAPSLPFVLRIVGGYLCVAFFGLCLAYALSRLMSRAPSLVIDSEGLLDNASAVGAGRLRWSEIEDVNLCTSMGQRVLRIVPRDPEDVLARQGAVKRCLMRLNTMLVGTPVTIPGNPLPMPLEELIATIHAFRQ